MPDNRDGEVQEKPPIFTSLDTDNYFWFTYGFRKFDVAGLREVVQHLFELRNGTIYDDDRQMIMLHVTQRDLEMEWLRH